MPDSWPFLPPYVPQHPLPEEQLQGGSAVPRLPALRGLTTSSSEKWVMVGVHAHSSGCRP